MSIDPVSIGIKVALMAAQMALTASQRIKGPRLDSLDVSVADYGTPIPRFWGKRRLTPSITWAEKLREVKHTSKTKGGKYDEYKYYATFAVLIADHEIDAVARIWMDKHLVYQSTDVGPVSPLFDFGGTINNGDNLRVYLGTESQTPDPRMEAWCEDRYGADTCPAYRGCAYMVFEEIPVEKFGNRIPQISVEAISSKTTHKPYESRTTSIGSTNVSFAINGSWMIEYDNASASHIEWWDLPTRTRVGTVSAGGMFSLIPNVAIDSNGTAYYYGPRSTVGLGVGVALATVPVMGAPTFEFVDIHGLSIASFGIVRVVNGRAFMTIGQSGYIAGLDLVSDPQSARDVFTGPNSEAWAIFEPLGSSNQFTLRSMETAGSSTTFTGLATRSSFGSPKGCYLPTTNEFLVAADGYFYRIDASTMTINSSGTAAWGEADILPNNNPGPTTAWGGSSQYSLLDGTLIRSINYYDWVVESAPITIYDPISNAIVSRGGGTTNVTWRYLDRIGNAGVLLSDIVEDVAGWCGLTTIDASDLNQTVLGYSVTQGSGKDMISPLLDIHDSDARPHDFTVQFKKRGQVSLGTLLTPNFVRDGNSARYTVTIAQDTDIPRRITLNYADDGKDQQTNTVIAQRPLDTMDSVREQQIDMTTYASTPSEAQQFTDRYFRRQWNEREEIKFGLTAQYLGLEPGDVWTPSLDGLERNARCTKITISAGALQTEWKRDEQTIHTLSTNTGAAMDGRDDETIYIPGPTKGFVLDIPLVQDGDAETKPSLYFAAGPYATTSFPGAVIYQQDGSDFMPWNAVDSAGKATWGYATNTLGNAVPWLWDRGNSVNIAIQSGTLVSTTEAAIDADTTLNMAYLGGELFQFATATLEGDGSYTLSDLKRGRRGTEGHVSGHAIGDEFVLASAFDKDTLGLDELGTVEAYKAATLGRDPSSSPEIDITFAGASLKPYAPARIKWTTDGTDLFGEITRRTRLGGAWVGGTTIPLSENSEAYEVEVYNGSTLKRTISLSGTNAFTYSASMMSADGNSVGTPPPVNIYQLSDAVGRGFALAA